MNAASSVTWSQPKLIVSCASGAVALRSRLDAAGIPYTPLPTTTQRGQMGIYGHTTTYYYRTVCCCELQRLLPVIAGMDADVSDGSTGQWLAHQAGTRLDLKQ